MLLYDNMGPAHSSLVGVSGSLVKVNAQST